MIIGDGLSKCLLLMVIEILEIGRDFMDYLICIVCGV